MRVSVLECASPLALLGEGLLPPRSISSNRAVNHLRFPEPNPLAPILASGTILA
jgi:hypothetical protein